MRRLLIPLILVASAFGQTNYTRMLSGVNAQTGTSYSLQPIDNTRISSFNNSSAVGVCLSSPASLCAGVTAGSGGFYGAGSIFSVQNIGSGTVTVTCQGCTINDSATLALASGAGADIYGDGTNFTAQKGSGSGGGGGGNVFTNPLVNQPIIQPTGTYFGINNLNNIRIVDPSYNWVQSPAGTLTGGVQATITLPAGILGISVANSTTAPFSVYISTQGTAESVLVTGGTYTAGSGGTIIFTPANSHSAGYTIGSAYGGVQEAINYAGSPNAYVVVPPLGGNTAYNIYAPVVFNSNKGTLQMYGALFNCNLRGPCFYEGDALGGTTWNYLKILGGRFNPGVNVEPAQVTSVTIASNVATVTTGSAHNFVTGDRVWLEFHNADDAAHIVNTVTVTDATHFTIPRTASNYGPDTSFGWTGLFNPAIEDSGDHDLMRDITFTNTGTSNRFNFGIGIDNDQAAIIDNIANEGQSSVLRCDANFCGALVMGRLDSGNSPVIWLRNSEISLQCGGNGVADYAGNSMKVTDSVIQGFSQYGIYYQGGLQGLGVDNAYTEIGSCTNPFYPGSLQAQAGIITGSLANLRGPGPIFGQVPEFNASGANQRNYYVVPHGMTFGYGPILFAGFGLNTGSGTVNVYWPQISGEGAGTITYDVLFTTGAAPATAPFSGSATSLATGISGSCSNSICTFADTLAAGSAYTVQSQLWQPDISFWPGSLVMSTSGNFSNSHGAAVFVTADVLIPSTISGLVSSLGTTVVSIALQECEGTNASWSPIWISCLTADHTAPFYSTILGSTNGGLNSFGAVKGRLNFGTLGNLSLGSGGTSTHLITLVDSNFAKTLATSTYRPGNDANDVYMGVDCVGGCLSIGAQTSQSNYLGNVGDGSSWKTRLNSSGFNFQTPIVFNNVLVSNTAPTISSGFGTSPSIANSNGTAQFTINVGTGGTANSGIIGLPSAAHGWSCTCTDVTTNTSTVFACKQTGAGSATTAPIGEFTAAGAAQAWVASDIVAVSCMAY